VATIEKWTPFRGLDAMERRMRRMFGDLSPALLPAADAHETADEYVIELEVPGDDEKEPGIEVPDHTLTVTGERTETEDDKQKAFRRRERLERPFERRFELPAEADTELQVARQTTAKTLW
jgi:HSP20 family molecular chaperone IbpA